MDIPLLGCEGENTDFLAIDDLLDFSNDDIGGPIDSSCLTIATSDSSTPSNEVSKLSSNASSLKDKNSSLQPPACGFDSDELCIRCDDLAELEWLSNFVEESFSSGDHTTTASFSVGSNGKSPTDDSKMHRDTSKDPFQSTSPVSVLERSPSLSRENMSFTCGPDMPVRARARTKRGRTAVCFWNTQILSAEASESLLESSSTASTITSDSVIINTFYDHDDDDDDYDENEDTDIDEDDDIDIDNERFHHQHKRPLSDMSMKVKKFNNVMASFSKEKSKKSKMQEGGLQQGAGRKCLHCATQKTPQWRAGPMGPKTLCNACGVRYKSGRLCAEYRPAASPTFIETVHSNSHRKVLEMRRQRGDFNLNPSSFHDKPQCRLGRGK
ncbi:hypothetical protein L7F22_044354 [Adiantum nelumboides]|nr:hypothetical protein [Adiantum nelumboides]